MTNDKLMTELLQITNDNTNCARLHSQQRQKERGDEKMGARPNRIGWATLLLLVVQYRNYDEYMGSDIAFCFCSHEFFFHSLLIFQFSVVLDSIC